MKKVPDQHNILTAADLRNAAKTFETHAQKLYCAASKAEKQWGSTSNRTQYLEGLARVGNDVAGSVGYDKKKLDTVNLNAWLADGIPPETVRHYALAAIKLHRLETRQKRDREALRLARLGYTNRAIAALAALEPAGTGGHPRTQRERPA